MSSEESVSLDHISSEYCRVFLAFNPHPPPHRAEKRHIWLRKNSDQATGLTGISPLCWKNNELHDEVCPSSGCSCSVAQSCLTLWDPMDYSTPGFPVLHYSPELAQTHVHQVSDAIKASRALLPLLVLPSVCPSIRVFSSVLALHIKWPKYRSFSFSISPSNEYSGLISFRMDWLDLLAVQGTLKSLLQHHSSKASILWHSVVFMVQLSHPYMTTGFSIAWTRWIFVNKVMSLLFNMLSRFVIAFLPRSKCLLISWLQSPSAVILEPRKIKPATVSIFSPSICHEVMGPDAMILVFWMLF